MLYAIVVYVCVNQSIVISFRFVFFLLPLLIFIFNFIKPGDMIDFNLSLYMFHQSLVFLFLYFHISVILLFIFIVLYLFFCIVIFFLCHLLLVCSFSHRICKKKEIYKYITTYTWIEN
jgi:hypothetical protein